MKLFLSAFFASAMLAPLSFASDCSDGKKCDKKKSESTLVANKACDCGECAGKSCADCDKCKKKEAEKSLLADGDCKKSDCDKDGGCDKKKEQGTV